MSRFFCVFVAPFCSCPVSLVSRSFVAVVPGCAKCFFLLRPVGRRDLSAGPEQNKKHPPYVCFLAPAPAKGRGRSAPLGAGRGWCFCFCSGPVPAPNGALPFAGAGAKKNTLGGVVFFCSGPAERSRRPTGRNK